MAGGLVEPCSVLALRERRARCQGQARLRAPRGAARASDGPGSGGRSSGGRGQGRPAHSPVGEGCRRQGIARSGDAERMDARDDLGGGGRFDPGKSGLGPPAWWGRRGEVGEVTVDVGEERDAHDARGTGKEAAARGPRTHNEAGEAGGGVVGVVGHEEERAEHTEAMAKGVHPHGECRRSLHGGEDRQGTASREAKDSGESAADGRLDAPGLGCRGAVHRHEVGCRAEHKGAEELHLGRDVERESDAVEGEDTDKSKVGGGDDARDKGLIVEEMRGSLAQVLVGLDEGDEARSGRRGERRRAAGTVRLRRPPDPVIASCPRGSPDAARGREWHCWEER